MRKGRTALLAALLAAVLLLAAGCASSPKSGGADAPETTPHVHQWRDGVCRVCGAVCEHDWQQGVCRVCGKVCAHEWEESVCLHCGKVCTHKWHDGVCRVCGKVCAHDWQQGVCTVCGKVCAHERHNGESLVCACCGMAVSHEYVNAVCTRCGGSPVFIDWIKDVPRSLMTPATEHGTTETYHYPLNEGAIEPGAHATGTVAERKQRDMVVYTPYGYDPETPYNVVIVSPGAGHNAHFWLEWTNLFGTVFGRLEGRELLDRLIEQGLIEPVIVVVVEYYHQGTPEMISVPYGKDLRERVLPFLAEHYATYASVDENGDFVAAPEHFAYVGASFGSMIGWQLLPYNTDLFSYWGLLSGAYTQDEEMPGRFNDNIGDEHPILWLYAGDGAKAQGWMAYQHRVENMDENCACLEMGSNLSFVAVRDTEHDYAAWNTGLINCLQIFFHNRFVPSGG